MTDESLCYICFAQSISKSSNNKRGIRANKTIRNTHSSRPSTPIASPIKTVTVNPLTLPGIFMSILRKTIRSFAPYLLLPFSEMAKAPTADFANRTLAVDTYPHKNHAESCFTIPAPPLRHSGPTAQLLGVVFWSANDLNLVSFHVQKDLPRISFPNGFFAPNVNFPSLP